VKGGVWLFLITALQWRVAYARPEYAAQEKLNCTSCHVAAWGGGPRTVFGKSFGSHGHSPLPTSFTDLYYADARVIAYYPTETLREPRRGLALMQASATANVPLKIVKEESGDTRVVATLNSAPLSGTQIREAYIRHSMRSGSEDKRVYFTVGRFYVPFGALTDEHRTYTRIQTNMTLNNYNVGGAVSADFSHDMHGDLALVNDFQTDGQFSTRDLSGGSVLSLRWNPRTLPFLLGVSANYQYLSRSLDPFATSAYAVVSLDQISKNVLKGSVTFERVDAKNWNSSQVNTGGINPQLQDFFLSATSDAAYRQSIQTSWSEGYYVWVRYRWSPYWNTFYKFDYLDLEARRSGGRFTRHGVGVEFYPWSNLIVNARFEKATIGRTESELSQTLSSQDNINVMVRLWL